MPSRPTTVSPVIVPPCRSTIRRTLARPIPVLPVGSVTFLARWTHGRRDRVLRRGASRRARGGASAVTTTTSPTGDGDRSSAFNASTQGVRKAWRTHPSPAARGGVGRMAELPETTGQRLPLDRTVAHISEVRELDPSTVSGVIEREGVPGIARPGATAGADGAIASMIAREDRRFACWPRAELASRDWTRGLLTRQRGVDAIATPGRSKGLRPMRLAHAGVAVGGR